MTLAVRFYAVVGENTDADGGTIEVASDGLVRTSNNLEWVLGLPAPEDMEADGSPSTLPSGGFTEVGDEPGGVKVFRPEGDFDAAKWLDRLRYHFRTPYLRPGEVEQA